MDREIRTTRIVLRPITIADLDELHRVWTDPEMRRYIWDGVAISRDDAAQLIARSTDYFEELGFGLWATRFAGEADIIGFCGFWYFRDPPELELIYGLLPLYWGKGLATESARAMIEYGFEILSFESIVATTDAANLASTGVMERAGMTFIKRAAIGGIDTACYAISRFSFDRAKMTRRNLGARGKADR